MPTKKKIAAEPTMASQIDSAEKTFERDLYSNHVVVALSANEFFADFLYISPAGGDKHAKVEHVQRMVLPVSIAKGLATAIANVVASYEAEHETTLPNSREPGAEDKITIWP